MSIKLRMKGLQGFNRSEIGGQKAAYPPKPCLPAKHHVGKAQTPWKQKSRREAGI
jgi:hypothetical protein